MISVGGKGSDANGYRTPDRTCCCSSSPVSSRRTRFLLSPATIHVQLTLQTRYSSMLDIFNDNDAETITRSRQAKLHRRAVMYELARGTWHVGRGTWDVGTGHLGTAGHVGVGGTWARGHTWAVGTWARRRVVVVWAHVFCFCSPSLPPLSLPFLSLPLFSLSPPPALSPSPLSLSLSPLPFCHELY